MDVITFKFLISLVVSKTIDMHLMDVITAYLNGDLDKEVYMKLLDGLKYQRNR